MSHTVQADVEPPTQLIPKAEECPTTPIRVAGKAFGISSSSAYTRAATGELVEGLPVIRVGGKYVVSTARLRRLLELDGPDDGRR